MIVFLCFYIVVYGKCFIYLNDYRYVILSEMFNQYFQLGLMCNDICNLFLAFTLINYSVIG